MGRGLGSLFSQVEKLQKSPFSFSSSCIITSWLCLPCCCFSWSCLVLTAWPLLPPLPWHWDLCGSTSCDNRGNIAVPLGLTGEPGVQGLLHTGDSPPLTLLPCPVETTDTSHSASVHSFHSLSPKLASHTTIAHPEDPVRNLGVIPVPLSLFPNVHQPWPCLSIPITTWLVQATLTSHRDHCP